MVGVLLLLLGLIPLAAGELLAQLCGNGGNYTTNGTYQSNLARLSATLPGSASSSPNLFATATAGQAPGTPGTVYALALCRGDVANATACGDCVAASFRDARRTCPDDGGGGATVYYDSCLLRFSGDGGFLAAPPNVTESVTLFKSWNQQSISGDAGVVAGNVRELLTETARAAAARRFATGFMDASNVAIPTLYALTQCTPDLPAGDCFACLQRLIGKINSTTSVRLGGRVLLLRCNLRFEAFVFYAGEPMLRVRPPGASTAPAPDRNATAPANGHSNKSWVISAAIAPVAAVILCLIGFYCGLSRSRRFRKGKARLREDELVWEMGGEISEFSMLDFLQVLEATDNFSEENKLGEGGFGPVYKGLFSDGLEIAVKRLSSHSGQGFIEFENELQLIAKLQHRNLVRLLGWCSQVGEKILVYEYLPNKSLDFYIFDQRRKSLLDWTKRLAIIEGIAEGLLYLHKHSRLRVIHRDLKPCNILLDSEMNPKISDFGLAKIFSSDSNEGITRRVVGTYGYMAPEYASEGLFSPKSDEFSFGVIILEIITGKRNCSLHQCEDFIKVPAYAWQLWTEERWLELVDASLVPNCQSTCVMRCINIALLCVQENAVDRPTMSDVVAMLSSESMVLDDPKNPAFSHVRATNNDEPL